MQFFIDTINSINAVVPLQIVVSVLVAITIMHVCLGAVSYLILLERKIASWAQDRIGPNRVGLTFGLVPHDTGKGMFGLGQPLADGIKFLMKEDYNPGKVDRSLFVLAPALSVIPALLGFAIIPWGGELFSQWGTLAITVADFNVGVVYLLAIGSLGVYGVAIGAWAANNKYTFLGGLRATAQMLSYEIPLGLCVLCILLMAGSSSAGDIIAEQVSYTSTFLPNWNIFQQPLVAVLFFTCSLAETNRAPFDLAECEQELIGGFHTEYSSMKFALFFLAEYFHMITACAFFTLMFLGGWHLPYLDLLIYGGSAQPVAANFLGVLLKVGVFFGKVTALLALMMWIRWTLPRLRFDQLMRLAWRSLIPLSILLLLMTGIWVYYGWTSHFWVGNIIVILVGLGIAPYIPQGPDPNRRVPLKGSRFSPAVD